MSLSKQSFIVVIDFLSIIYLIGTILIFLEFLQFKPWIPIVIILAYMFVIVMKFSDVFKFDVDVMNSEEFEELKREEDEIYKHGNIYSTEDSLEIDKLTELYTLEDPPKKDISYIWWSTDLLPYFHTNSDKNQPDIEPIKLDRHDLIPWHYDIIVGMGTFYGTINGIIIIFLIIFRTSSNDLLLVVKVFSALPIVLLLTLFFVSWGFGEQRILDEEKGLSIMERRFRRFYP